MFPNEAALQAALQHFRQAEIGRLETYTPAPLQSAAAQSPIPGIILAAGLLAAAASFGLQAYSATIAYRFDIGGRPALSWPSFLPTVFENAVLVAIAAGFVAFMAINRLPRLYDPIDEVDAFREASRDGWFLAIEAPLTERQRIETLLRDLHPIRIDTVPGS